MRVERSDQQLTSAFDTDQLKKTDIIITVFNATQSHKNEPNNQMTFFGGVFNNLHIITILLTIMI